MNQELVRQRLYEKYIEPTKKERKKFIGIEIEMPILNLDKEAVNFSVIHEITAKFMKHFQFEAEGIDDEGNVYSIKNNLHGDILSYDCSYNNLELSLGREKELFTILERFRSYYEYLQNQFHQYPEYGTFSSASQVQLDVDYEDLVKTIRVFSLVEPVKALLFSNSILLGENEDLLCCRDMFWENSTHGINPHNVGMFDCRLESEEDLLSYIESTSIYCVERGEKYINFSPVNIMEYFTKPFIIGEYYKNGAYQNIKFEPEIEDLQYLRTFKFEDLTFRGTVEFRSVCCQPIKDCMTVAAFHLGLKNQIDPLENLLKNDHVIYHHGYTAGELRKMFNQKELPSFVDEDQLYGLAKNVLDLAKEGLRMRGYGEEVLLEPLYERVKNRTNPAKTILHMRDRGVALEDIILEYGKMNEKISD